VLLIAVAVAYLFYARAEGRDFRLPGSDGAVVFAAGIWAALLLIFRLFDKPGISSHGVAANVGVQWGIFFALAAAGMLAYAGSRMRAARHLEPPLTRRPRPGHGRPRAHQQGEPFDEPPPPAAPREGPEDELTTVEGPARSTRRGFSEPATAAAARVRPRYPPAPAPAPAEQMSFEDPPPEPR
jgi:hypothetical protein